MHSRQVGALPCACVLLEKHGLRAFLLLSTLGVWFQEFDGRDEATPAYVALRGEVFDVSSKPEHYKKGGGYHLFAGQDASYSLATGSLSPADLGKRLVAGVSLTLRCCRCW